MIATQLHSSETCEREDLDREVVFDLVHDLRQPLSSIEAIACYLDMRLGPEQEEIRSYVLKLQDLVEEANQMLSHAIACRTKVALATV